MLNRNLTASFKLGASAVALLAVVGASGAAYAQEDMETIVVTGYRASLEKAMDMKRNSLGATDSIMAEDIAKFPDMNVSESLQRIPGVAINRDAGEGRQITVRGLGPLFSRVRINGIEAMSTAGGSDASGGTNRGRSFDFNVFGSELFSGLTVNKSASASMEEGSLGATVDMRTARPFDYNRFVLSAAVQEGYNDFAGSANPKGSFLISDVFLGGRFGALFSAAYTVRHTLEAGASTVRSSGSDNSAVTVDASGTKAIPVRPRMPRYETYRGGEKRLGLSSTLQWQADDNTLFTLSGMFSDFASTREETQLEMQTNAFGTMSGIANQVYLPAGNCGNTTTCYWQPVLNSVSGAKIRTEHRQDQLDTRFMQVTLEGSHSFSEQLKTKFNMGWSESHHRNPVQDYIMLDQFNVAGYGYDFQNDGNNWSPELTYGSANFNIGDLPGTAPSANTCTSGANCWFVSSFRRRPQYNFNSFRTASWDFEYKPLREITISGGFDYKNYGFGTASYRLATPEGSAYAGTSQETFASAYNQNAYGTPAVAAYYGSSAVAGTFANKVLTTKISDIVSSVSLPGYAPGATPKSWFVVDFDKADKAWGYRNALKTTIGPDLGNNRSVTENDYAGWLQVGWDTELYGMSFRGDVGGRYVNTMVRAIGYGLSSTGAFQPTATTTGYHDFLPTLNAVLEPVENVLVRLNMSQVMSRPDLGSLAGDYLSVSGTSFSTNVANSNLKPFRANTIDLAFEWYYGKGAMLSVSGFYKKLGTFIASYRNNIGPNAAGDIIFALPSTVAGVSKTISASALQAACGATPNCTTGKWTVSESINTPGGHLDGVEINWQQPFTFLPDIWSNFGVTANGTFVESNVCYMVGTACSYHALTNQSRNSYNTTIYYDDTVFQARVSAAYRSHYFMALPGGKTDFEAGDDTFNLDASASYKFNEHFMITVDALNLTDQHQRQYTGYYDSSNKYMYVNHRTGTDYYIGIKYDF